MEETEYNIENLSTEIVAHPNHREYHRYMISKWLNLKPKAILLRKSGKTFPTIESKLGIPRSTLSGWFKNLTLSNRQSRILKENRSKHLKIARQKANVWHNAQKATRLKLAENEAEKVLFKINNDPENIELALAMLYLGEGFKKSAGTGMGNSDPLILKFFLHTLINIYHLDVEKMRFYLHLRADQDPEKMKKYWSKELNVPIHRFGKVSIDTRTVKTATYNDYKGVCMVNCANIAIQRKLLYIGRKFCEKIIAKMRA